MAFSPVPSFVKSLETVTVIREIIIEWKSFLVLYNYNLKLSLKVSLIFLLQSFDKIFLKT